jgi:hypothetical protein
MNGQQYLLDEYPNSDDFRRLLTQFPEDVLAKRYLLTGVPYIFKEHPLQYISFCETVARNLDIGSHDVAVVGSTRIGYSLSPDTFGTPVRPGSDVDTVVVSENLFKGGMEQVLDWLADIEWREEKELVFIDVKTLDNLQSCARNFRNGFLAPNLLPDGNQFKQRVFSALNEVATQLLAMKPPGPVWKVRCRIFDTWKSAEGHYASSLRRLKRDLAKGDSALEHEDKG